jgi:hypothetical protein
MLARTLTDGTIQEVEVQAGDGLQISYGNLFFRLDDITAGALIAGATGLLLYAQRNGDTHDFFGLLAGDGIQIANNGTDLVISSDGVGSIQNVGGGVQVLRDVVSGVASLRTLTAGAGVSLVQNADTIQISATSGAGTITGAANVGTGQGVFKQDNAGVLEFLSLITSGAIAITQVGDDIQIQEALGVGNGISRVGDVILLGGTLTQDTIIDGQANSFGVSLVGLTSFTVLGSDQILLQTTDQAEIRGDGGVTINANGGTINIGQDDTIILGNSISTLQIGVAYELPTNQSPDVTLNAKSALVWTGDGVNAIPAFEDIAAFGGVTSIQNVGAGAGIWRDTVAAVASLKSLIPGGAISIVQNSNDLLISENITGANGLTRVGNAVRLGGTQDSDTLITGAGNSFALAGHSDLLLQPNISAVINTPTTVIQSANVQVGDTAGTVNISNRYDMANVAPGAGKKVQTWTDGTPAFEDYGAAGGGLIWREVTVDGDIFLAGQAKCNTASGIVFSKPGADTVLVTIPDRVDLGAVQIWIAAKDNPGNNAKFQFDFQGVNSDGSPRLSSMVTNVILPDVTVGNAQLIFVSPSDITPSSPILYNKTTGAGTKELRLVGINPLTVEVVNFNQNNTGGNGETVTKITF